MFRSRTLFVLGAGASAELDFPIGIALIQKIAERLAQVRHGGSLGIADDVIQRALLHHVNGQRPGLPKAYGLNDFMQAAWKISKAMPLATSIDTFMDTHAADPCIQLVGKLAIVRSIMEAEKDCLSAFGRDNGDFRLDAMAPAWFVRFFKALSAGVSKDKLDSIFHNVMVISFNYDRTLENFLELAIAAYYDVPATAAVEIVKKLSIIHPYGTVGPWREGGQHQPFGMDVTAESHLLQLAERIQTFTEVSPHSKLIKQRTSMAELIVFLGFGYIEQNMQLLGPDAKSREARRLIGTALKRSGADCEIIDRQLATFISPTLNRMHGGPKRVILFNGACAEFFDEYAQTITSDPV